MKRSKRSWLLIGIILFICAFTPTFSQNLRGEAGIGFMAISPPMSDTISAFDIKDMLYGVNVSYLIRPWLGVSTDVMYLGDLYYGPGDGAFSEGPLSWTSLSSKAGAKADWQYYESFIYAPLSINLTAPLGFIRPYIGLGPAFYFHFASTNQDKSFTEYLKSHYGKAGLTSRIGQGLTIRVGLDILVSEFVGLGLGYVVREDTPSTIFTDLGTGDFYREKGYLFVAGKFFMR
ncbi:MAG TPA: outer membrane beta-barrel protein [Rectinema sp.]|nr:outer membrane beta-barrel protein [Rectinema sp.]